MIRFLQLCVLLLAVGIGSGSALAAEAEDAWVAKTFEAYEALRDALAEDRLDDVTEKRDSIAKASEAHAPGVKKAAMAIDPAADSEAVRKAFGDLSREMIALAKEQPSAKKGRFVFSCGMAQGYSKWIQVSKTMANPYMGQRMLECGSRSDWSL